MNKLTVRDYIDDSSKIIVNCKIGKVKCVLVDAKTQERNALVTEEVLMILLAL